jgi:hypothetical protein
VVGRAAAPLSEPRVHGPTDVAVKAKAVETVRRVLMNLATIADGAASLRNIHGSGHGKKATTRGLEPRHARLAVGAASALAVFLDETHQADELGDQ